MTTIDTIRAEIERQISDLPYTWSGSSAAKWAFEALLSFLDTLESEKPITPNDLEEAAENYIAPIENDEGLDYINFNGRDIKDAFIAGAKWQAEQLLKSSPLPEDTVLFNKGVEEGKRLMMEDAMEGEIMYNPYPTICLDDSKDYKHKDGDKVRIIIVKKD